MSKLKKNLALQTIYQIVITITPLITAPYLARKLGASSLGVYSYTLSITNYFLLFCMLGFINYGTRAIASISEKKEQNKMFSEIYLLQLICCFVSLTVFLILLLFFDNKIYLLLQSPWIISCFFDVTWYFFGKEEFKITVIRNLIVKVITIVVTLLIVKNPTDLWKYILIMSLGILISQFSLWIIATKNISFKNVSMRRVFSHLKPVCILFVPILAMSVYHIMDKTMLGALSTAKESGYYFNSDKIVSIPFGILTGIGTVMLSNITALLTKGQLEDAKNIFRKSLRYVVCLSIGMAFGIAAISKEFIPVFFGPGYDKCILLVQILSVTIIAKCISDISRTQYMIPYKKEKYFIVSVIVGSVINLILNFMYIYVLKMGALGATLGTVITEIVVCAIQIVFIQKDEKIVGVIVRNIAFIIYAILMYISVRCISVININIVLKIIVEIAIGGFVYLLLLFIHFNITNDKEFNDIKNTIKNKLISK